MTDCIDYLQHTYCEVPPTPETILDHSLIVAMNLAWEFATWFIPTVLILSGVIFLYGEFISRRK